MRSKGVGGRSGFFVRSQLYESQVTGSSETMLHQGSTEAAQEPFGAFGPLGDLHRAMQAPMHGPAHKVRTDCARVS